MAIRTVGKLDYNPPYPLLRPRSPMSDTTASARFYLDSDVSFLFPYINAELRGSRYFDKPDSIRFVLDGILCTLYPKEGLATPFTEIRQARDFAEGLIDFLNDLERRKDSIVPDHRRHAPLSALAIYRALPRTNCGKCGRPTCMAFAVAISQGQAIHTDCPEMPQPIVNQAVYPIFDNLGVLVDTIALETARMKPTDQSEVTNSQPSDEQIAEKIAEANRSLPEPLTERELEVLGLVAQGLSNNKIATQSYISINTVKTHIRNIRGKLSAENRVHAIAIAREIGLLRQ